MKLTQEQLKKIVEYCYFDFKVETQHRKGSTFYANGSYEITEEDISDISKAIDVNVTELDTLVGTCINTNGVWDDNNGCDWFEYSQSRKVFITVPEKIIPEHTVVELQVF